MLSSHFGMAREGTVSPHLRSISACHWGRLWFSSCSSLFYGSIISVMSDELVFVSRACNAISLLFYLFLKRHLQCHLFLIALLPPLFYLEVELFLIWVFLTLYVSYCTVNISFVFLLYETVLMVDSDDGNVGCDQYSFFLCIYSAQQKVRSILAFW